MKSRPPISSDPTDVPWTNVSTFVRQLAHDIRNDLNALELEIALLSEQKDGASAPDHAFSGLRESVRNSVTRLRLVSARVDAITIRPTRIPITDLVEVTRERIRKLHPSDSPPQWDLPAQGGSLEADISLLAEALAEIVSNAIDFREDENPIKIIGRPEGHLVRLDVVEKKQRRPVGMASWGSSPLQQIRRSHYGLGLYFAARVVVAHGGTIDRAYDATCSLFRTSILLPLTIGGTRGMSTA